MHSKSDDVEKEQSASELPPSHQSLLTEIEYLRQRIQELESTNRELNNQIVSLLSRARL